MIRPSPSLDDLERRLARDPAVVPTLEEARRIEAALRRQAADRGALARDDDGDPMAGLDGALALARSLRGLPPA